MMFNQCDKDIRPLALQIAGELSQDESATLVFLCLDVLKDCSAIGEVKDLFEVLSKQNLLRVELLTELLYRIRRFDLLKKLKVDPVCFERSLNSGHGYISLYRQLLMDISENLSQEDFQSILFLLRCQVPKGRQEAMKTFLDLIVEMEKLGKIDVNNLEVVEDCLQSIGRIDLRKKVLKYKQMTESPGARSVRRADVYQNVIPISVPCQEQEFGPEHFERNRGVSALLPVRRGWNTSQSLRQHVHPNCPRSPAASAEEHRPEALRDPVTELAQAAGTASAAPQGVSALLPVRRGWNTSQSLRQHVHPNCPRSPAASAEEHRPEALRDPVTELAQAAGTASAAPQVGLEMYRVQSRPLGLCLIIDCIGTDADLLKETFEALQFRVDLHLHVELDELKRILRETSQREDLAALDCFVCCIVSRGTVESVLAIDGNIPGLSFDQIQQYFKGQNCRALLGKPRLFFVQDFLTTTADTEDELETDIVWRNGGAVQADSRVWKEVVPQEADILWSCCRVSEQLLLQTPQQPSSFVHALSDCLQARHRVVTQFGVYLPYVFRVVTQFGVYLPRVLGAPNNPTFPHPPRPRSADPGWRLRRHRRTCSQVFEHTMEDTNFQFQALLNDISENLGSDELKAMKFFCRDLLRSNQLSRVDSGHKLFIALQEKGLLDVTDTFLVAELLYRTRQFRLLKKMRYDRWEVSRQLKDPAKARISLYRQLLFEVSEDITMKDLETVKHFLHNCLSKSKLESITTMLDVFVEMEKEGLLEEENMELLKKICKELGEHLVLKFDHYRPLISAQCSTGRKDENGGRQDEESVVVLAPTPETTFPVILSPQRLPSGERWGLPCLPEAHSPSEEQFSRLSDTKEQDGNSFHSQNIESLSRYKMESNPRGYCVIINNYTFKTMSERRGSHVDAGRLLRIFSWLGFEVDQKENLTAAGMQDLMSAYQEMDHTPRDCFVCCILTHGEKGVMCGTDGQHVAISEITSFFTGRQCPTLREKPKLFFIQACQGTKKQDSIGIDPSSVRVDPSSVGVKSSSVGVNPSSVGVKSSSVGVNPSSVGVKSSSVGIDPSSVGVNPSSAGPEPGTSDTTLEQDAVSTNATIPDEADFLLGMATVEGYVSYRHTQQGTWYIQSLCENLEKYCASEDLLSILTIVNRDVSGKKDNKDKTQMPQPRYTLRKKLYFPVTQTYTNFTNSSKCLHSGSGSSMDPGGSRALRC
ncbi:uncharacterized protein LOC144686955 [Cetorhinus maximus]